MHITARLKTLVRIGIGVCTSFCLAASLVPAAALAADGDTLGSVERDGWTLSYSIHEGEATITGAQASDTAAATLGVPEAVEGAIVTGIGERAFKDAAALTAIDLPETLEILGSGAFMNSGLEQVEIPASVEYIPYQCFRGCAELASVTFEQGATPEYIGTQAFYNCAKIEEITVPPLVGKDFANEWVCHTPTTTNPGYGAFRVGIDCFVNCKKLKKIVFLPGNEVGISEYCKDGGEQFGNNASGLEIFVYCPGSTSRYQSKGTWYFVLDFYQSKEDADADKGRTHPWKQMVYKAGVTLLEVLKGTCEEAPREGSDELPEMPQEAQDAGKVWGIANRMMDSAYATLSKLCVVYPVDRGDLDYGWVSSPEILTAKGYDTFAGVDNANGAYVRLCSDGKADLSGMTAYAADGSRLDDTERVLKYESGETVVDPARPPFTMTEWTELESGEQIAKAGRYRVRAVGVGSFASTETATVEFGVKTYSSNVFDYTNSNRGSALGNIAFSGTSALGSAATAPKFTVVAPASSWQHCLIAAGLAGVGDAQAVITDGGDTPGSAYSAIQASGVSDIIYIGSEAQIGSEVVGRIRQNVGASASYDFLEAKTAEDLAVSVYKTIKKYGPKQTNPYEWGDTAVVVSGTYSTRAASAAQYAYQAKAPVFFAAADGSVSSQVLSALRDGEFSKVIIAGGTDCVSADAERSIAQAAGVAPQRILSQAANAAEAVQGLVGTMQSTFTQDGVPVNDSRSVVVSSSVDPVYVIAAGQLAAARGCVLLTAASSADLKQAERYCVETSGDMTSVVYLVGDLDAVCKGSKERFQSVWDAQPASTTVGKGDTIEADGVLYKLTSSSAVTLAGLLEPKLTTIAAQGFTVNSRKYSVTAIGAGSLKGRKQLSAVSTAATTIGANAFQGCTGLKAFSSNATSIGASAFQGCTSLGSFSAAAKTIGANAFQGCTGLKAFSSNATSIGASAFQGCAALASVKSVATSVGAKAFAGCTKLASISIPATSVGAGAFQGCTALSSAKLSSKTLKSLPASVFQGCSKLSRVQVASTALTSVGANAFASCSKLVGVTLASKKLKAIAAGAFKGCAALKSLELKSTKLKSIGATAFQGCKKLKSLTLKTKKLKTVGAKAFKSAFKKMKVKVPKAKVKKYAKLLKKAGLSKKAKVVKL